MSLRNIINQGGSKSTARTPNTFGVVMVVKTAVEKDGHLLLTGVAETDVPGHGRGAEIAVSFRGDDATRAVNNFVKGAGSRRALAQPDAAAGTVLTLESCYLTENERDGLPEVSSRWLNTLRSSFNNNHSDRNFVENVFAGAPRVSFANPRYHVGSEEPKRIDVPVGAATFHAFVEDEDGRVFRREFDAGFAVERLRELPKDSKPQVYIDIVSPTEAVQVRTEEELRAALAKAFSAGTRAGAVLRVSDGELAFARLDLTEFKQQNGNYEPDAAAAVARLLDNKEKGLFRNIKVDSLLDHMQRGEWTVEVIPAYRLNYSGDPTRDDNAAFKLIQDVLAGRTTRYEVMFGKKDDAFASVLLPGISHADGLAGFTPINVIADRPQRFTLNEMPTSVVDPRTFKAKAPQEAEELATAPAP